MLQKQHFAFNIRLYFKHHWVQYRQVMISKVLAILFLMSSAVSNAQNLRYFQFNTLCGHGNWQDTSFVAAASDTAIISKVFTELSKPFSERKFIGGNIAGGNGGHNFNASHQFLWHFIPNKWDLVEMAIEACDGCPTDVDADTTYWIHNLGIYCPWNGKPVKEIFPVTGIDDPNLQNNILIYPNPNNGLFKLEIPDRMGLVTICDLAGRNLYRQYVNGSIMVKLEIDPGIYLLYYFGKDLVLNARLIVE